jgi:HEAT repeat protein
VEPSRSDLVSLVEDPAPFLSSPDPVLRRMAVTALDPGTAIASLPTLAAMARDEGAAIRAAVAEKLGVCGHEAYATLGSLQGDPDPTVREAVATAYGELGLPLAIEWLVEAASSDPDRSVREASVASLGSIGDDRAIDPLLELMAEGPPQVRRRAVAAITVFDDPRIEPAIIRAAFDRNPGVREAAEMVVGRQLTLREAPVDQE